MPGLELGELGMMSSMEQKLHMLDVVCWVYWALLSKILDHWQHYFWARREYLRCKWYKNVNKMLCALEISTSALVSSWFCILDTDCEVPPADRHGFILGSVSVSPIDSRTYMSIGDAIYYGCDKGYTLSVNQPLVIHRCPERAISNSSRCFPKVSLCMWK